MRGGAQPRFAFTCWFVALIIASGVWPRVTRADSPVPETFSYTTPASENRVRALLELSGVFTLGFLFYASTNGFVTNLKENYRWPRFRSKLLGEALELDVNGLNTNFVGHAIGGSMYYMMARTNRLSVAESFAIAIGGSLIWEVFGEVSEIVSINDMIVTPLSGVALAEPMTQLGAFFDRSSPALRNRVLGAVFAPIKTLNDWFDGRTLLRSQALDAHGFPAGEWHQFDLRVGAATTSQDAPTPATSAQRSYELRISLASQLVRLPGYDGAAKHSIWFDDANASSIRIDAALTHAGLVDLDLATQFAFAGHAYRAASTDQSGELWGQGTLIGLTMGYQYVIHDYDRDRVRLRDNRSTVQPLGVVFEHRAALGELRLVTHVAGGSDFGGVRPYARRAYQARPDAMTLPDVLNRDRYYFAVGGHLLASAMLSFRLLEASGRLVYERYSQVGYPIETRDQVWLLEGRASVALGDSPARVSVLVQRRARSGDMGDAHTARGETSTGIELGARY